MVGILTREVLMSDGTSGARERVAAGTEVYVRVRRDGTLDVRLPGTLLTQTVYVATVDVP